MHSGPINVYLDRKYIPQQLLIQFIKLYFSKANKGDYSLFIALKPITDSRHIAHHAHL